MIIETYEDLLEWTRRMHANLAGCLAHCSSEQQEHRAKWLLSYLADHEQALQTMVAGFAEKAPAEMLHTWFYNYLSRSPIVAKAVCEQDYAHMDFDHICKEIFAIHNQIITLYKDLSGRADLPEAVELFENLLQLEQHQAMQMATQIARSADL